MNAALHVTTVTVGNVTLPTVMILFPPEDGSVERIKIVAPTSIRVRPAEKEDELVLEIDNIPIGVIRPSDASIATFMQFAQALRKDGFLGLTLVAYSTNLGVYHRTFVSEVTHGTVVSDSLPVRRLFLDLARIVEDPESILTREFEGKTIEHPYEMAAVLNNSAVCERRRYLPPPHRN